ncbi:hypothetical protein [Bradyrhizobium mercantei]|uniref:hypothetical protein n=1 Tax=Bradyrhizobium mercantei TaxID=1904807 RepID=UPI0013564FB7|nr:hypothetical protein [Bradyrhizobium mercantei]
MQDFGVCIQSSQIGPQRVQPLSMTPIATTPPSNTNLRNMYAPTADGRQLGAETGAFSSRAQPLQRQRPRVGTQRRRAAAPAADGRAAVRFDRAAAQITVRNKAEKESINDFGDELGRVDAA